MSTQPPYPVQGRFGVIGYDKTLALPGDLAAIAGAPGTAANNGFLFVYPSRNVQCDLDAGVWDVEIGIWTGADYTWVREIVPVHAALYYPEVSGDQVDDHDWMASPHVIAHVLDAGAMAVFGYDGGLALAGDLQPGADNGFLFNRPIAAPHIMSGPGGSIWHGRLNIDTGGGIFGYVWAVYPVNHVLMQPMPASWLP